MIRLRPSFGSFGNPLALLLLLALDAHAGTLTITPPSAAFGSVSVSAAAASQMLTISNQGPGGPTQISGFTSGAGCAEFTVGTSSALPALLSVGESITVTVTYDPTNRGSDACTFTVQDDNAVTDTFGASGTGIAAKLLVTGGPLGFTDQLWDTGTGETQNLTIENVGTEAIGATNLSLVLTTGIHFTVGTTAFPIEPGGGTALVPVTFNPTSVGFKSDLLTLSLDNDLPVDPNSSVQLSGTGTSSTADVGDASRVAGLHAVRPSPTSGAMTIEYSIAQPGRVSLEVRDLSGRVVGRTLSYASDAGPRSAAWRQGIEWSPSAGVYFVRLALEGRTLGTRRVVVLK